MNNMKHLLLLVLCVAATPLFAQKKYLKSGPMLGYVEMKEALLWAQTTQSAEVSFEFWPADQPARVRQTDKVRTHKEAAFTAKCVADELEPGVTYQYRLLINGKKIALDYPATFTAQRLWQFRTDPPTFTVLAGSCNYVNETEYDRPGKPYGSDHSIFSAMYNQKADAMIWLGDNAYLREVDWATNSGILHRYTHTRALPELQPFWASTAHYATWDDHDFGPNDSDGTWVHKDKSLRAFELFWGNPTFGIEGSRGVTTAFKYNDVDFFLLDNRYHRTPDYCKTCPERTQLGATQLKWLLESLSASTAPFKIVAIGGQVLTTNGNHETYMHYNAAERDTILAHIERENIKNVIFLTGDRHFTELSTYTNAKGNAVYDLTTSSMTAGIYKDGAKELNAYRVEGTLVTEHNFANLQFSGPRTERVLTMKIMDKEGKELWSQTIKSQK